MKPVEALLILFAAGFVIGCALVLFLRARRTRTTAVTGDGTPDRLRGFHLYRLIKIVRAEREALPALVPYKSRPTPEHEKPQWMRPTD